MPPVLRSSCSISGPRSTGQSTTEAPQGEQVTVCYCDSPIGSLPYSQRFSMHLCLWSASRSWNLTSAQATPYTPQVHESRHNGEPKTCVEHDLSYNRPRY